MFKRSMFVAVVVAVLLATPGLWNEIPKAFAWHGDIVVSATCDGWSVSMGSNVYSPETVTMIVEPASSGDWSQGDHVSGVAHFTWSDSRDTDNIAFEAQKPDGCEPPPVDICPNIEGTQEQIPDGMVIDENGNCVVPSEPPQPPEPPVVPEQPKQPTPGQLINCVDEMFFTPGTVPIGKPFEYGGKTWLVNLANGSYSCEPVQPKPAPKPAPSRAPQVCEPQVLAWDGLDIESGHNVLFWAPVVDGNIGEPHPVEPGFPAFNPTWSPDHCRLAFNGLNQNQWDIYWVGIGGGNPYQVTDTDEVEGAPYWDKDSGLIYFSNDSLVHSINEWGRNLKDLGHGTNPITLRNMLAFNDEQGLARVINMETDAELGDTQNAGTVVSWSPDGSFIVVEHQEELYKLYQDGTTEMLNYGTDASINPANSEQYALETHLQIREVTPTTNRSVTNWVQMTRVDLGILTLDIPRDEPHSNPEWSSLDRPVAYEWQPTIPPAGETTFYFTSPNGEKEAFVRDGVLWIREIESGEEWNSGIELDSVTRWGDNWVIGGVAGSQKIETDQMGSFVRLIN